jgi:hypothetical protein
MRTAGDSARQELGGLAGWISRLCTSRSHTAAAESAGLIVLHYDADYDRIAAVTGQPVEWVVPRGSV